MPAAPAFDFKPDPRAASPLYLQLAHSLATAIRGGVFNAEQALPSERRLAERLALSRVTARSALDRLVEQRLIVRKRGSGHYVAPRPGQPMARLAGFSDDLHQRGFVPGSRWLLRGFTPASPEEQLSLALKSGERVARLAQLRLADAVVIAYEVSVLLPSVLPDPQRVQGSLYAHLGDRAPVRARQHIRALNADDRLAGLLGIAPGAAVLFITRLGFDASGRTMELTQSTCRSDYFDFVAEMHRSPAP